MARQHTPVVLNDAIGASGDSRVAHGSVAQRLLESGFNINSFRTLDILRKEEWKAFDNKVVEIARERLVALGDLISRGLNFDLPNALGTTQLEWETTTDMDPAHISMSGVTPGQYDRVTYSLKSMPLPLVHKEFTVNIRALEASRTRGTPMDTTQAALAARKVAELNEQILFDGASIVVSGTTIYGLTNHPNRNTGSLISNWADSVNTTGEEIVADVLQMIDQAQGDHMFGPYLLYVPIDYGNRLNDDYKANSDKTIRQRIMEIEGISGIITTARLSGSSSGETILLQLSTDVIDIINGLQPMTIQWPSMGGWIVDFRVVSMLLPRIKADSLGQSGIVHHSV